MDHVLAALEAIMNQRSTDLEAAVPGFGGSPWTGVRGMDADGGIEPSSDIHFPARAIAEIENETAGKIIAVLTEAFRP